VTEDPVSAQVNFKTKPQNEWGHVVQLAKGHIRAHCEINSNSWRKRPRSVASLMVAGPKRDQGDSRSRATSLAETKQCVALVCNRIETLRKPEPLAMGRQASVTNRPSAACPSPLAGATPPSAAAPRLWATAQLVSAVTQSGSGAATAPAALPVDPQSASPCYWPRPLWLLQHHCRKLLQYSCRCPQCHCQRSRG
jgi:hypothetical protein